MPRPHIMAYEQTVDSVSLSGHVADVAAATYSPDGSCIVTSGKNYMSVRFVAQQPNDCVTLACSLQALMLQSRSGLPTPAGSSRSCVGTNQQVSRHKRLLQTLHLLRSKLNIKPHVAPSLTLRSDVCCVLTRRQLDGQVCLPFNHHVAQSPLDESSRHSGSADGIVLLHRGASHDIIQKVGDGKAGHGGGVWDVCFTIKGKAFITACEDALIRVWQVGTGNVIRVLRGHASSVNGVCFSPLDGRIVCRCASFLQSKTVTFCSYNTKL